MTRLLLSLLALPLAAAITEVRVDGVTATQAVVRYTAPDTSACTHEISDSATYSPLVNDVRTTLFPGANSDGGGLRARTFVVGKRTVSVGADGLRYSRALETNRTHYGRISCGADQATYTFTTNTVRLGNVFQEATPGDGDGGYEWPDINLNDPGKIIDPFTGVATYVVMEPRDFTATSNGNAVTDCSGTGWTGVVNCLTDNATYASTTGTDPLLAVTSVTYMSESHDGPCGSLGSGNDSLDYVQVELNGYGAGGTEAQRAVNV